MGDTPEVKDKTQKPKTLLEKLISTGTSNMEGEHQLMALKQPEFKTVEDVKKAFENDELIYEKQKFSGLSDEQRASYKPETFNKYNKVSVSGNKIILTGEKTKVWDAEQEEYVVTQPKMEFYFQPNLKGIAEPESGIDFLGYTSEKFGKYMGKARKAIKEVAIS